MTDYWEEPGHTRKDCPYYTIGEELSLLVDHVIEDIQISNIINTRLMKRCISDALRK